MTGWVVYRGLSLRISDRLQRGGAGAKPDRELAPAPLRAAQRSGAGLEPTERGPATPDTRRATSRACARRGAGVTSGRSTRQQSAVRRLRAGSAAVNVESRCD